MTSTARYNIATLFLFAICFIILCALAGQSHAAQLPQQCRCKQAFATLPEAKAMAVKRYENERYELEAYKCDYCPSWHLTSGVKK